MESRLGRIAEALAKAEDLDAVGRIVRVGARGLTAADGVAFVLREDDRCFYADEDSIAPLWKGQRFPMTSCISGWAMIHGEAALIGDIHVDERIPQAAYAPTYVRSLAMVPMGTPAVGAIGAYWAHRPLDLVQALVWLEPIAEHAAQAIGRVGSDTAPPHRTFSDINRRR
jgi:hypothetical protein